MRRLPLLECWHRPPNVLFAAALALVGFIAMSVPLHAQNFVDASIGLQYDDNASRGFLSSDTHADTSANIAFTAGRFSQLRNNNSLAAFASLSATKFDRHSGLDSQSVEIGTTLTHKFGLGAYVPVLRSTLTWRTEDSYKKTRDRQIGVLDISMSKRLSPTWLFEAGVSKEFSEGSYDGQRYQSHYSSENDIYDFQQQSLFTTLEYSFSDFSTVSLEYSLIDGYTVSSALAPNPRLLGVSKALTLDPAIDAPAGRSQVAYTLETRVHLFTAHWSYPIGMDSSLTLSASRQIIIARKNVDYSNNHLSISFIHSF